MATTLVSSKLTIPLNTPDLIERKQLFDLLQNQTFKKVTVLRAPAGYGKTTVLSSWFKYKKATVAWLSLDAADNDPIRFGLTLCMPWRKPINALSIKYLRHFYTLKT